MTPAPGNEEWLTSLLQDAGEAPSDEEWLAGLLSEGEPPPPTPLQNDPGGGFVATEPPESDLVATPEEPSTPDPLRWLQKGIAQTAGSLHSGLGLAAGAVGQAAEAAAAPRSPFGAVAAGVGGLAREAERVFAESAGAVGPDAARLTAPEEAEGYIAQIQEGGAGAVPSVVARAFLENAPTLLAGGSALRAGKAAGAGVMWLLEGGEQYRSLTESGVPEGEARAGAALVGAVNAALEAVPMARLLKRLDVPPETFRQALTFAGTQALAEGGTEALQGLVSSLDSLAQAGEKIDPASLADQGFAGAVLGLLTGGLAGGAGAVRAAQRPQEAPEAAPGPEARTEPPESQEQPLKRPEGGLPTFEDLQRASEAVAPTARVAPVEGLAVSELAASPGSFEATGPDGAVVGTLDAVPAEGGFRVIQVSTGSGVERGTGAGRALMRAAFERYGPYRGSVAESDAGEGFLARLRETDPDIFGETRREEDIDVRQAQGIGQEAPGQERGGQGLRQGARAPEGRRDGAQEEAVAGPEGQGREPAQVEPSPGRRGEGGFLARPRGLARDLRLFAARWGRRRGNLPESAYRLKLDKDHALGAHSKGVEYRLRELNRNLRSYDGPLTQRQLTRYLGDALRGNVAISLSAETSSLDDTQIQRIARNLAERDGRDEPSEGDLETARAEASRVASREPASPSLPPALAATVGKLRADIDGFTRALRREGLLDDAAARELERSFGLYVHRTYEAFEGDNPEQYLRRVEGEPLWARARDLIASEHPELSPAEIEGGMRKLIERGPKVSLPGGVPEGAKNRSTLFERKSLRELERLLLGERRDVRAQAVDTVLGQAGLLEHHRFLVALRSDGLGSYLRERPAGRLYRPIDEAAVAVPVLDDEGQPSLIYRKKGQERTDPVSGLHTTPEILQELEEATPSAREVSSWLRAYMTVNFAVKANLTVGSPQTQARNVLSNFLPAMTNGYLPFGEGAHEALDLVVKDLLHSSSDHVREQLMKYRRLGVLDQGADYGDLRRMGRFADLMRVEVHPGNPPVAAAKGALRKAAQAYAHGDNLWKILGWHKERARLADAHPEMGDETLDKEAALVVRETLQNYSELPRFARAVSVNPILAPFFSFTWAMLRGIKNTALRASREVQSDNPKIRKVGMTRLAGMLVALPLPEVSAFALRWISNTDGDDDEALREFVPVWDRGATLAIMAHSPGSYTYFNWGFMDYFSRLKEPVRLVMMAASSDRSVGDLSGEFLSDFGEEVLAGALVDAVRGQTADGYRIWLEHDSFEDKTAKGLEHLWKTGRPGVLRSAENIRDAAAGRVSPSGYRRRLAAELVALAGPRIQTIDVPQRLGSYGRRFRGDLADATRLYTREAGTRGTPDRAAMVHNYRRANEERVKILRELRRKIDAGVTSGLSLDDVVDALDVPEKYVDMALGGYVEPLSYERGKHWEKIEEELRAVYEDFSTGGMEAASP